MVWGMNHPPVSNGPFFLPGEFEGPAEIASCGWRKRLKRHFDEAMPPAEQAVFQDENNNGAHWYACHAVNKFSMRREFFGTDRGASVAAIRSHEIPLYFRTSGNPDKLASLAQFAGPVLTADEALKSFIEWLEPGVHKFFPIEVRRGRDKPATGIRYILVVERRLDSFSEVRSHKGSFSISDDRLHVGHVEKASAMRRLAFRKDDIGSAHLWHEKRFNSFLLCMSDRLQEEIADSGLRIPKHFQMTEV